MNSLEPELVERYRGRWVVVNEIGDVVADAAELGELLKACEGKALVGRCGRSPCSRG